MVGFNTGHSTVVWKCGNAACSNANTSTIADTDAVGGPEEVLSIALGADGLPVISYSSPAGGALKVLKCGNASCS